MSLLLPELFQVYKKKPQNKTEFFRRSTDVPDAPVLTRATTLDEVLPKLISHTLNHPGVSADQKQGQDVVMKPAILPQLTL